MKIRKILPYKMTKLLPILGLAGATSVLPSCEKDEIIPTKEVEIKINPYSLDLVVEKDANGNPRPSPQIEYYVADPYVKTIYVSPCDLWEFYKAEDIQNLRKNTLEYLINYSPKIRGKNDFIFAHFEIIKIPEDSLWFIQHGWTINQSFKQK